MTKPIKHDRSGTDKRDKAELTTAAANSILKAERAASDAKVARLKALRLASHPAPAEPPPTAPAARTRQRKASAIRQIKLTG